VRLTLGPGSSRELMCCLREVRRGAFLSFLPSTRAFDAPPLSQAVAPSLGRTGVCAGLDRALRKTNWFCGEGSVGR